MYLQDTITCPICEKNAKFANMNIKDKKIKYRCNKGHESEYSFNEVQLTQDIDKKDYLLSDDGNYYMSDDAVLKHNEALESPINACSLFDYWECKLPPYATSYDCTDKQTVIIQIKTNIKLNNKIWKGITDSSFHFDLKFSADSAAWIIKYQDSKWRKYVISKINKTEANDVLRELISLYSSETKLRKTEASKVMEFITKFVFELDKDLIKEIENCFCERNCEELKTLIRGESV